MSLVTIGRILRHLHLWTALVFIVVTVLGPSWTVPWLTGFWLVMVLCNLLNGGCPITRIERQLTGEDETVIDPFLALVEIPVTRTTRNFYTVLVGIIMLATALIRFAKWRQVRYSNLGQ